MQNSVTVQQKVSNKWILRTLLFAGLVLLFLFGTTQTAHAATAKFVKKGSSTYYLKTNGKYAKNELLKINGSYYYFNSNGTMLKGWQYNNQKQKIRYFNSTSGKMVTGFVKTSNGKYRYFNTKTGLLYRGWCVASNGKARYFESKEGYMWTGWFKTNTGKYRYFGKTGYLATGWVTSGSTTWYFDPAKPASGIGNYGIMYTGLKKINGNNYYFSSTGKLYKNTTQVINGTKYSINSKGVACPVITSPTSTVSNNHIVSSNGYVTVKENGKSYQLYPAYLNISGIANGKIDDVTLLAAVADREMGGSTLNGMVAVCVAILNRTLPENTAWPNNFRQVIFQSPYQFSEDGYGSFALLERRLKGPGSSAWHNEKVARQAAAQAFTIFNNYVKNKTPRTISGFSTKDFNYIGFMTPAAFAYGLSNDPYFKPLKYETYANCCTFYDRYSVWGNK